jgi:hypothetical protein
LIVGLFVAVCLEQDGEKKVQEQHVHHHVHEEKESDAQVGLDFGIFENGTIVVVHDKVPVVAYSHNENRG